MPKKLRVCVVGAGNEATAQHLPAYAECEGAELAAVCDVNEQAARAAAQRFALPAWYTSHAEMLEKEKPDIVSVCVPNKFHADITVDALQAGCHVLCEKPPALSAQQAAQMAEAARKAGRLLSYNLHWRWAPEAVAAKRMAEKGDFGTVYFSRAVALRRRGIPGWGNFTNKDMQGGGALIDIGVHMLDTALHLLGYPAVAYVAAASSDRIGKRGGVGLMGAWNPAAFTVEDGLFGTVHFENGGMMMVESAFALNVGFKQKMNVELYGDLAGASVFERQLYGENGDVLTDTTLPFLPEVNTRRACIGDFVRCCAEGRPPLVSAAEGVQLMQIVDGLYRSARQGAPIWINEEKHHAEL